MMILVFVLICFSVTTGKGQLCQYEQNSDPCLLYNSQDVPYIDTRHPDILHSAATSGTKYCDLYAMNEGTWYRSTYDMTSHCVNQDTCGTKDPIWLNGSIPNPEDGAVNRTACLKTYTLCCAREYRLQIKNCHFYTVYCFFDLPSDCPQRYCFDIDLSKITTTTTSTKTTTTSTTMATIASTAVVGSTSSTNTLTSEKGDDNTAVVAVLAVGLTLAVCTTFCLAVVIFYYKRKLMTAIIPVVSEKPGFI